MRAAVYHRYGPPEVVRIEEVPKPAPRDDEVLIRVHATTVCAADWRLRKADPFLARFLNGLLRPKRHGILGMEFSGTIEAVGAGVSRFSPGEEVFGSPLFKFGAHAEYVCLSQDGQLERRPANMALDEAAAVMFGAMTAAGCLRKAGVRPGQRVLIYGASGSVGVFAVQLAKHFGAHVTGVCSTANLDLVRSLGADAVVDYTREDFAASGPVYDVIFDTVGYSGVRRSLRALKRGGVCLLGAAMPDRVMLAALWARITGAGTVIAAGSKPAPDDPALFKQLIEAGVLRTVIDRRFTLDQIADAHRLAEGGHKRGHALVVIG
jgi:NADPH:quinone reductase-like Zn-dependent oxidoreductase